ncbi:hypothetical protein SAMN05444374_104239 [Rhodococcoides kroppenstedtii]|uniref:Uncharacterized protein n=1 Tax=Rhodococcoides kroppenstedtii TaxID=293050 RepID=A0A1I0T7C2_9NOCA|nr:hypothetical protein [Rhodococcus kroppenstedtii]MBT1193510.1 hypothetical protein [Rhodococcus kroppenstedtii]SFA47641.1 hypothetical protein SAMN05444374_104239 [Rhodococcus kroppenstedtii]
MSVSHETEHETARPRPFGMTTRPLAADPATAGTLVCVAADRAGSQAVQDAVRTVLPAATVRPVTGATTVEVLGFDRIVVVDDPGADRHWRAADIARLLATADGVGVGMVVGTRRGRRGLRLLADRVAASVLRSPVADPGSGLRIYSGDAVRSTGATAVPVGDLGGRLRLARAIHARHWMVHGLAVTTASVERPAPVELIRAALSADKDHRR